MPPNVPPVPLVLYCLLGFSGVLELGVSGGSRCRHTRKESCRNLGCGSVTTGPRVLLLLVGVLNNREAMAPSLQCTGHWTLYSGSGQSGATDLDHEKHAEHFLA